MEVQAVAIKRRVCKSNIHNYTNIPPPLMSNTLNAFLTVRGFPAGKEKARGIQLHINSNYYLSTFLNGGYFVLATLLKTKAVMGR